MYSWVLDPEQCHKDPMSHQLSAFLSSLLPSQVTCDGKRLAAVPDPPSPKLKENRGEKRECISLSNAIYPTLHLRALIGSCASLTQSQRPSMSDTLTEPA